jgi:hypothetical protein
VWIHRRLFYQGERGLKVRAVPADCVRGFLCVDLLPVGLCVHTDQCSRLMDSSLMMPRHRHSGSGRGTCCSQHESEYAWESRICS